MAGRRNASTKLCSNAHVGGSAEAEKAPQSVSKAKMVVNLIKKFTHSGGGGGGSAATNSGNGPSSSSAKKGSGRLDSELERLNSKIVSCTYLSLSLTLQCPSIPFPSSFSLALLTAHHQTSDHKVTCQMQKQIVQALKRVIRFKVAFDKVSQCMWA